MTITANGEERPIPEGTSLAEFLHLFDLPPGRVAVERNGRVVPKDRYATTVLDPGDRLEVVTLVGGG